MAYQSSLTGTQVQGLLLGNAKKIVVTISGGTDSTIIEQQFVKGTDFANYDFISCTNPDIKSMSDLFNLLISKSSSLYPEEFIQTTIFLISPATEGYLELRITGYSYSVGTLYLSIKSTADNSIDSSFDLGIKGTVVDSISNIIDQDLNEDLKLKVINAFVIMRCSYDFVSDLTGEEIDYTNLVESCYPFDDFSKLVKYIEENPDLPYNINVLFKNADPDNPFNLRMVDVVSDKAGNINFILIGYQYQKFLSAIKCNFVLTQETVVFDKLLIDHYDISQIGQSGTDQSLVTQVNQNKSDITSLKSQVNQNKSDITSLKSQVGILENRLGEAAVLRYSSVSFTEFFNNIKTSSVLVMKNISDPSNSIFSLINNSNNSYFSDLMSIDADGRVNTFNFNSKRINLYFQATDRRTSEVNGMVSIIGIDGSRPFNGVVPFKADKVASKIYIGGLIYWESR